MELNYRYFSNYIKFLCLQCPEIDHNTNPTFSGGPKKNNIYNPGLVVLPGTKVLRLTLLDNGNTEIELSISNGKNTRQFTVVAEIKTSYEWVEVMERGQNLKVESW